MAWIESHTVLVRHRKVLLTAHDLGIKPVVLVGHLTVFWHAVLEQQEDGNLDGWPSAMIAQAAAWDDDADVFVHALRLRGWIDDHLVHDWLDYVGKFLHSKYSTSNPKKLKEIYAMHGYKYGKGKGKYGKVKAQDKRNVSTGEALEKCDQPNLLPNQPNLTKPSISISRKRALRSITDEDRPTEKHKALAQSLRVDLGAEWGKFKNYCLAHDKRYANFEAAFRNWIANSVTMRKL